MKHCSVLLLIVNLIFMLQTVTVPLDEVEKYVSTELDDLEPEQITVLQDTISKTRSQVTSKKKRKTIEGNDYSCDLAFLRTWPKKWRAQNIFRYFTKSQNSKQGTSQPSIMVEVRRELSWWTYSHPYFSCTRNNLLTLQLHKLKSPSGSTVILPYDKPILSATK